MRRLRPEKLHVQWANGTTSAGPAAGRHYTLTHSDATGDLFLTIGPDYNEEQISGWYTRLMRDEVLAEWREEADGPALHVYCHVSGGIALGAAGWRNQIFRRELPLVLEAIRYGDRELFAAQSMLDQAPIKIHFHATQPRYNCVETWGKLSDYQ